MTTLPDDGKTTKEGLRPYDDHLTDDDHSSLRKGDLLNLESVDPVLNEKMFLVNNAIDEIGFTPYHMKLFILNGFG